MRLIDLPRAVPVPESNPRLMFLKCTSGLGSVENCYSSSYVLRACFPCVKIGPEVLEMPIKTQATIEDLYHVPENGKAESVSSDRS